MITIGNFALKLFPNFELFVRLIMVDHPIKQALPETSSVNIHGEQEASREQSDLCSVFLIKQ